MSAAARRALVEALAVLAGSIALAVLATWPLARHLDARVYGDSGAPVRTVAWLSQLIHGRGFHIFGASHVDTTGAPFGWTVRNGANVGWLVPWFPGYAAARVAGAVAAYNLVVVAGLALSGAAMYALVRSLPRPRLVAAWAALAYTLFPWHVLQAGHDAALAHMEGFPLLVLACLAWFRAPRPGAGAAVVAATALLCTTAPAYEAVAVVALAVALPLALLGHARRLGLGRAAVAFLALAVATGAVAALVGVWSGTPHAGRAGLRPFGARPWEYVVPPPGNPSFGAVTDAWLSAHLHGSTPADTALYVGWITLSLAAGWVLLAFTRWWRHLVPERKYLALTLTAFVAAGVAFSLPSPLFGSSLPAPVRLAAGVVPGFGAPSDFQALVMTGLVPLAALGLGGVRRQVFTGFRGPTARALGAALCVLFGLLTVFELSTGSKSPAALPDGTPRLPLGGIPGGSVAQYPLVSADDRRAPGRVLSQSRHGRPLLDSAPPGTFADAVRQVVVDPLTDGTPASLASLGVRVVTIPGSSALANLGPGFRLVARPPGRPAVWRVVARRAPAIAAFRSGFGAPESPPGAGTARWLTRRVGVVEVYSWRSGSHRVSFRASSYAVARRLTIAGEGGSRAFDIPAGGRSVSFLLRLRAGAAKLVLRAAPGPGAAVDGRRLALYLGNWSFTAARPAESPLAGVPATLDGEPASRPDPGPTPVTPG